MGPDDGYILHYSKDVSQFWADRGRLALGMCFEPSHVGAAASRSVGGMLPARKFTDRISKVRSQPRIPAGPLKFSPRRLGFLTHSVGGDHVSQGFQASATFHQGDITAAEVGASGELKSTVSSYVSAFARSRAGFQDPLAPSLLPPLFPRSFIRCRWEFCIEPLAGWGPPERQQSTAGWLSALPIFEPHWQVLLAHGEATGWIEWGDRRYEFEAAPAYSEKNWGGGFPNKWIWIQCNSFLASPGTSVTAVGAERGLMQLQNFTENVGLIGIHHRGQFFELNIKDSSIVWEASTWGQWKIEGRSDLYEAVIEAACGPEDGTPLRAPTADQGLAPICKDSFAGKVRLRLWHRKSGRRADPILDLESDGKSGAVEVGGSLMDVDGTGNSDRWRVEAEMSPVVRGLLAVPDPYAFVPDWWMPPGM